MNIDGLQELVTNRSTSTAKPVTARSARFLNVFFPPRACVDVRTLVGTCKNARYNQHLCQLNNSVVRLSVTQRAVILIMRNAGIIPRGD